MGFIGEIPNKKQNTVILIYSGFILVDDFYPEYGPGYQGHGGIEGVIAHQIAHLFFIISMGGLIYWSRQRGLVRERGWQLIRLSGFFRGSGTLE
jgi:hypothetical protein